MLSMHGHQLHVSESTSVWMSFLSLLINLPFTAASSCKPTAVETPSSHWVTKLCIAIAYARTAVGKSKIPSQALAAVLTAHLPAAGALPSHLVTQRAQWALRVALTCWKTPKAKLYPECTLPPSLLITDTAPRQCKQWGWKICYLRKYFIHCFTYNH